MLTLKGKLKRLDGGMPRYDFWEMVAQCALEKSIHNNATLVRQLVSVAHRVKPEYEAEVASWAQMLCESNAIIASTHPTLWIALELIGLKGIRVYRYEIITVAVETDRFWLVYPVNVRTVNRLLSRRKP